MEAPRGERCESCVEAYQDRRRLGAAVGWAVALTTPAARRRRCRLQRQRRPDSAVRVTSGERQVVLLCVCPPNEVQTRRSLRVFVIAVRVCRGMRGYVLSPRLPYPRRLAVSRARRTVPRRTVPRATARGVHTVHGTVFDLFSQFVFGSGRARATRTPRTAEARTAETSLAWRRVSQSPRYDATLPPRPRGAVSHGSKSRVTSVRAVRPRIPSSTRTAPHRVYERSSGDWI